MLLNVTMPCSKTFLSVFQNHHFYNEKLSFDLFQSGFHLSYRCFETFVYKIKFFEKNNFLNKNYAFERIP